MQSMKQKDPSSRLERYELKFVIPVHMVDPMSDFVSIYCSPDKYSEVTRDGFYMVNNLYFDSPGYLFLKKRLDGSENRFNMRVRSYGDHAELPHFFEIKQKKVDIVRKYRARIHDRDWCKLFETPAYELKETDPQNDLSNADLFLRLAQSYQAAPKVLTQYKRKAFVSDVDDYARVTFDTDLRYQPADGYNLAPDELKMVPLDNATLFDAECSIILELKFFSTKVPLWMVDLIRTFNLRRRGFSKYVTGVREVLSLYRYDKSGRAAAFQ